MQNQDKDIDETFKAGFRNLEGPAPKFNWASIEEETNKSVDAPFQDKLKSLKVNPKPQVWDNIKTELPLHPGARRYFSWMTKIAAVLVIGMLLCILSDQSQQHIAQQQKSIDTIKEATVIQEIQRPFPNYDQATDNMEYVFEVTNNITTASKIRQEQKEKAEMKKLLRFILEEDEDLALLADEKILNKSLTPASAIQADGAIVYNNKEKDLEIHIPLIVVENDKEAERLIRLYDASYAPSIGID